MSNVPTSDLDEELVVKTSAATATANNAAVDNSDLDVEWGDEDAMSREGLDRIKPADDKSKVRVAVLSKVLLGEGERLALMDGPVFTVKNGQLITVADGKPVLDKEGKPVSPQNTPLVPVKMAWGHFILKDGKKSYYRCLSKRDAKKKHRFIGEPADCCHKLNGDKDQAAQLNFAVLALRYVNADPSTGGYKPDADGNIPPIKWELGWLKLSRAGFKALSELALEGEEVHQFDFTVSKKDNGIGYEYKRKSKTLPLFYSNPELLAEVRAEAAQFADGKVLSRNLGKVVSAIDMKALLAGNTAAAKAGGVDNTDDL